MDIGELIQPVFGVGHFGYFHLPFLLIISLEGAVLGPGSPLGPTSPFAVGNLVF